VTFPFRGHCASVGFCGATFGGGLISLSNEWQGRCAGVSCSRPALSGRNRFQAQRQSAVTTAQTENWFPFATIFKEAARTLRPISPTSASRKEQPTKLCDARRDDRRADLRAVQGPSAGYPHDHQKSECVAASSPFHFRELGNEPRLRTTKMILRQ